MRGVRAIPGINPPAKVCNKGQRERVAAKANRGTNTGETCHEGLEGVLVSFLLGSIIYRLRNTLNGNRPS